MKRKRYRSLATLAALRELAAAKAVEATTLFDEATEASNLKGASRPMFDQSELAATVARELTDLAAELEHYRSYATARFIIGPLATMEAAEAGQLVSAIRKAKAVLECTGEAASNIQVTVRLVPYYDHVNDEERWATEFIHSGGEDNYTDHDLRQDAEYRYWDLAAMLGHSKPE